MSSPRSKEVPLPPPPAAPVEGGGDGPDEGSFAPASQAQILRSYQRDAGQVHRLTELSSELIRSAAGSRWLAHRQTAIDVAVRAIYLLMTFGRGAQTLGEEYTDILPRSSKSRRPPSKIVSVRREPIIFWDLLRSLTKLTVQRRILTIVFLILPSILTSPSMSAYLRRSNEDGTPTRWSKLRQRLARFIDSPIGQSLPELHMMAFLLGGKYFEAGRRIMGMSYISTLPPRPPEERQPSYEPLAILTALPLLYRLFPRRRLSEITDVSSSQPSSSRPKSLLPTSPNPEKIPHPEQTLLLAADASYDAKNTYLTEDAQELPERQCTLCLEPRGTGEGSGGTVAVTECGHVFCWGCLGGLEKPECPLCRQTLRMERLVAAYNL